MLNRALALVLLLTVVSLAQGIAMRLKLADAAIVTPAHIGLGLVTALIILGLTRSARRQKLRVAGDLTFLFFLILVQGVLGILLLADVGVASIIHLILSFFIVASAANSLLLSLTRA